MVRAVRAKFRCVEKTSRTATGNYGPEPKVTESESVKLSAIVGPGNEAWSKYTPSGTLEMQITNPAAIAQLEVGKDYFIDITPAE